MKFVNLKTCDGIETYLHFDGGLLRLSLLPEKLRSLSQREFMVVVSQLTNLEKNRGQSRAESGKGWTSAATGLLLQPATPAKD